MVLLVLLLQAFTPASEASQTLPPMPLERAIRELDRPRIDLEPTQPDRPTFRLEVQEWLPIEPWVDRQTAPWRLKVPRDHYEFLASVTPERFRGPVLHPCCIPVLTIFEALNDRLAASRRTRREAHAKEAVEQALRDWRAANAKDQ